MTYICRGWSDLSNRQTPGWARSSRGSQRSLRTRGCARVAGHVAPVQHIMVLFSLKFLGEAFSVLTLSSPFFPTNLQWFMFETWFCSSALFLGRACSTAAQQGLVADVQPQKYLLWDQTVFVLLKRYISWFQCSQYFKHILDFNRGNDRCECTDISKFIQCNGLYICKEWFLWVDISSKSLQPNMCFNQ